MERDLVDPYLAAGNEENEGANTFHALKGRLYREARPSYGARRIDWIIPSQRLA
jgi:hypothetical protein